MDSKFFRTKLFRGTKYNKLKLGQSDIIEVLEKSDKPMSRTQIAAALDIGKDRISRTLQILLKHDEVKCIELDRFQAAKLLGWDIPIRRTRFFYLEDLEDTTICPD